jgi:DNA-binding NarL/FixJ family response regulator
LNHAGWEICGEASANVLVKDWVMPGVSTLEVTREIARRLPDTAIVLFPFHDHHGDHRQSRMRSRRGFHRPFFVNTIGRKGLAFFGESSIYK